MVRINLISSDLPFLESLNPPTVFSSPPFRLHHIFYLEQIGQKMELADFNFAKVMDCFPRNSNQEDDHHELSSSIVLSDAYFKRSRNI